MSIPKRVLVAVVKDRPQLKVFEQFFRAHGDDYALTLVDDGKKAWEVIRKNKSPLVAVLNRVMPGMDTLEICRRNQSKRDSLVYVVVLTNDMVGAARALAEGADACLTRPITVETGLLQFKAVLNTGWNHMVDLDNRIKAERRLTRQVNYDLVTSLRSRRAIYSMLKDEIEYALQTKSSVGVIDCDLDGFKQFNERFGKSIGDYVLRQTAQRIRELTRSRDETGLKAGRTGGDEFLIVLPNCGLRETRIAAERIRKGISRKPIKIPNTDESVTLTLSMGIAVSDCDRPLKSRRLLSEADRALRLAKHDGKDVVRSLLNKPAMIEQPVKKFRLNPAVATSSRRSRRKIIRPLFLPGLPNFKKKTNHSG